MELVLKMKKTAMVADEYIFNIVSLHCILFTTLIHSVL